MCLIVTFPSRSDDVPGCCLSGMCVIVAFLSRSDSLPGCCISRDVTDPGRDIYRPFRHVRPKEGSR